MSRMTRNSSVAVRTKDHDELVGCHMADGRGALATTSFGVL